MNKNEVVERYFEKYEAVKDEINALAETALQLPDGDGSTLLKANVIFMMEAFNTSFEFLEHLNTNIPDSGMQITLGFMDLTNTMVDARKEIKK